METHASDEISKERQRRSQHNQGGDGGGDVDGLEGGMAAVRLGGREDTGGEEDAEANGGARSENAEAEEEDVDDDDQDCDYVPENYHDENSKYLPNFTIVHVHSSTFSRFCYFHVLGTEDCEGLNQTQIISSSENAIKKDIIEIVKYCRRCSFTTL